MLRYALSELGHVEARRMAELFIGLLDPADAWVEYYQADRPQGTRYRPWESAINDSALVRFARGSACNKGAK